MVKYLDKVNSEIKDYFKILEPNFPEWLNEYINTKDMSQESTEDLTTDIIKALNNDGKISKKDLYTLKESEVIELIENSKYKEIFDIWKKAKKIKVSKEEPSNVYYVHHGAKVRYIDLYLMGNESLKLVK